MFRRDTFIIRKARPVLLALLALLTAALIAACGGSSGNGGMSAQQMLTATFKNKQPIDSGVLHFAVTIVPHGSKELTEPITVALGGPFQSGGAGKLPDSDFTIALSIQGEKLNLGLISAGGHGYITDNGQAYELPQSNYRKLESGIGSISGEQRAKDKQAVSSLKIEPLDWLSGATIAGTQTIGGVQTTRIHARIDVQKMVADVIKLLKNSSSLGVSGSSAVGKQLSAADAASVQRTLGSPSFDVWTGTSDHLLRRLVVTDTIPVRGKLSTQLDGLNSAGFRVLFGYSHVNEPQTIHAPTSVKPYSEFQSSVESLLALLGAGSSSGSGLGLGSSGASGSSSAGSGASTTASGTDGKYEQCIVKAAGDISKMQKCQSLLP